MEDILNELYLTYSTLLNDLNIGHTLDNKKIEYYNELNKEKKRILDEYEKKFGPIELCSDYLNRSPWSWDNDPWPWEV